jgi:hypothetical protein
VGGAAGGTTRLLYYRSREVISVALVVAEAHPRAVWPQRWRWCNRLDPLTSYVACSRLVFTDSERITGYFENARWPTQRPELWSIGLSKRYSLHQPIRHYGLLGMG